MKKYSYLIIVIFCGVFFFSCGSNKTSLFQDLDKYLQGQMEIPTDTGDLIIKSKDELTILISSVDPAAVLPFNIYFKESGMKTLGTTTGTTQGTTTSETQKIVTYFVDNDGYINLPTLGKVKVGGSTQDQARDYLEQLLKEYIKEPIVNLWVSNFRVSVIGAVNTPGPLLFTNQKVSILDAIAAAGDFTMYGRPDNVLLIREIGGKKELLPFDLTKTNIFSSPNFYLQQNDIVYVTPNDEYQRNADVGTYKQFTLTMITSAISTLIGTITLVIAARNK